MGGVKHDKGKSRLDLIPPEALEAMGDVFRFGAEKYGDRNWELGLDPERLRAAALRHLNAYEASRIGRQSPTDDESGMPHLWHALTCVAMMVATIERQGDQSNEAL